MDRSLPCVRLRNIETQRMTCRATRRKKNQDGEFPSSRDASFMHQAVPFVELTAFASTLKLRYRYDSKHLRRVVSQGDPHSPWGVNYHTCQTRQLTRCGVGPSCQATWTPQPKFETMWLPCVKYASGTPDPSSRWQMKNWSLESHLQGENSSSRKGFWNILESSLPICLQQILIVYIYWAHALC